MPSLLFPMLWTGDICLGGQVKRGLANRQLRLPDLVCDLRFADLVRRWSSFD
jgi:hypothetical protein